MTNGKVNHNLPFERDRCNNATWILNIQLRKPLRDAEDEVKRAPGQDIDNESRCSIMTIIMMVRKMKDETKLASASNEPTGRCARMPNKEQI